jgi:hypothetical protein
VGVFFENKAALRNLSNPPRIKVYIGRIVSGEISDSFRVTDSTGNTIPNRVWVYTADLKQTFTVWNHRVTPAAKMPVWIIRYSTKEEWQIQEADVTEGTVTYGAALGNFNTPEKVSGLVTETIPAEALKPLRARKSEAGGLNIYIEPAWVANRYWGGGNVELTTSESGLSSGEKAWVIVGLTVEDTLTAAQVAGTAQSVTIPLVESDVEDIAVDANFEPVAYYELREGDTEISTKYLHSARHFFAGINNRFHRAFASSQTKTLATGVVTPGFHRNLVIAAESGTADDLIEVDDLVVGDRVWLRADSGDTITVKHNDAGATNKIHLYGNADVTLDEQNPLVLMQVDTNVLAQAIV